MSTRPFRFIHAGDFHLERPLMGVAEVPDHLRELFLDAPYAAAQKVFDAALAEDADFLVLSGDILQASNTGPRGPLFLVEQFTRLAERGIGVYWAGGEVDPPEGWPAALALPENVHVFPQGRIEEVPAQRNDEVLARLTGVGRDRQRGIRPGDFAPDPTGLYSIAVMHGTSVDPAAMQARAFHYWALGGRHDRSTPLGGPQVIHYCGSPQGRQPEECGAHGCTLVQVDGQYNIGQTRTSLIPTDSVRWHGERLIVDASASRDDLQMRIRDRMAALLETSPQYSPLPLGEGPGVRAAVAGAQDIGNFTNASPHPNPLPKGEGTWPTTALLISWTIAGQGPLIAQLRRSKLAAELLQWLRGEYGHRSPAAWSVSLEVEISETLAPEWYEQETIRGDFLRAVRQLQMNPDDPLSLDSYMAEAHLAGVLSSAAALSSETARNGVLREAAVLGVDLLSGEESHA